MSEGYLAVIQQLITENQTLKSANRRLTNLCQNVLDDVVNLFGEFFPSILLYDSDCIFKAGDEICGYYRKQLLLVQSQLCKNLLHLLNIYGLEVEEDLENLTFDNLKQFVNVMRTGKGGLIQQIAISEVKIKEVQLEKDRVLKDLGNKQLQLKKLSMKVEDNIQEIYKLSSTNQLLMLDIKNLTNQLNRVQEDLQTIYADHNSTQIQLNTLRSANEELRRQILQQEEDKLNKILYSEIKI